jgi:hypothetical protein
MSHTTYGRAGGPSIQQVRENWGQTATSILIASGSAGSTGDGGTADQPMLPVTTGEDYYLIWGWSVGTNLPTGEAAYGYIQSTAGTADIAAFAITAQGPMMMTFDLPIRLAPGQGVDCKLLAVISSTVALPANPRVLPVVYYSKVIV